MIVNDYRCVSCDHRQEVFLPHREASAPACRRCGRAGLRRLMPAVGLAGRASTGVARENMPRSWEALGGGDRQTIAKWREIASQRERLEDKHPELAGDRRPVLAHEGQFADAPLRAGDPLPGGSSRLP